MSSKRTLEQENRAASFNRDTRLRIVQHQDLLNLPPLRPPPSSPPIANTYEKRTIDSIAREIARGECAYFWDLIKLRKCRPHWWRLGKTLEEQIRKLSNEDDVHAVLAVVNG